MCAQQEREEREEPRYPCQLETTRDQPPSSRTSNAPLMQHCHNVWPWHLCISPSATSHHPHHPIHRAISSSSFDQRMNHGRPRPPSTSHITPSPLHLCPHLFVVLYSTCLHGYSTEGILHGSRCCATLLRTNRSTQTPTHLPEYAFISDSESIMATPVKMVQVPVRLHNLMIQNQKKNQNRNREQSPPRGFYDVGDPRTCPGVDIAEFMPFMLDEKQPP